jgi:hypothetical protein
LNRKKGERKGGVRLAEQEGKGKQETFRGSSQQVERGHFFISANFPQLFIICATNNGQKNYIWYHFIEFSLSFSHHSVLNFLPNFSFLVLEKKESHRFHS